MLGVSRDGQRTVCVLQRDVREAVASRDDRNSQHPRHDWGDLCVVAQRVKAGDVRGAGPLRNDQVGQDTQGGAEPIQRVGACRVGGPCPCY